MIDLQPMFDSLERACVDKMLKDDAISAAVSALEALILEAERIRQILVAGMRGAPRSDEGEGVPE